MAQIGEGTPGMLCLDWVLIKYYDRSLPSGQKSLEGGSMPVGKCNPQRRGNVNVVGMSASQRVAPRVQEG